MSRLKTLHGRDTNAGTPAQHRRVPHSHPGVKPIAVQPQLAPTHNQATPHHRRSVSPTSSDTRHAIQAPSQPGRAPAVAPSKSQGAAWVASSSRAQPAASSASHSAAESERRSSVQFEAQSWCDVPVQQDLAASLEQPSKAPQDSGDSDTHQGPLRKGPRASRHAHTAPLRQLPASQSASQPVVIVGQCRRHASPSTSAYPGQPPGFTNPTSDGRTVVVSGFRKGAAGPQARQQTLDVCAQFGDVSCCWLRKGKSSCWFTVVQFAEVGMLQSVCWYVETAACRSALSKWTLASLELRQAHSRAASGDGGCHYDT